jgi:hypothetical protein
LGSTTVSIGASTNQTYNNFSNGSYAPVSWITAKEALSGTNKTVMSANGLYQMIVGNATSGLFLSSDSGITWTTLTGGLPTLTGSAYWSDGAISANGQYITLSIYGGSLWMSADYGRTFALTNQSTPNIWLQLNGNVSDSMGLSVVTTPGTVPGYVTVNYPGYTAQAVNLLNTAGGTATRYIRGTWSGAANFTVSLWFNAQTVNGTLQPIFEAYFSGLGIFIGTNNFIYFQFPNGGAGGNTQLLTSFTVSVNTWYYVTGMFQTNGLCSFYVNNTLIASSTNTGGVGTITSSGSFGLGTFDTVTINAFNGYVDDLRITNSVSTYVPIPLLKPNIWMPFENSAVDLGSNAITPTVTGSLSYVPGVVGLNAVNLVNTAGGTPSNYIRGAWSGSANSTVSLWFNLQSLGSATQTIFGAYQSWLWIAVTASGVLGVAIPTGGGNGGSSFSMGTVNISLNTWYHVVLIFQTNALCSFHVNGSLIGTLTNVGGTGTLPSTQFSLGSYDFAVTSAFNGYIDDFRLYNAAIPIHQLLPQNYRALALSGSGQYTLASAASGWVVGSSNWSQTWSKQAVNVGTQSSSLSLSHTGQYQLVATGPASGSVMPNLTGLAAYTWSQGGVNWGVSTSSFATTGYEPYRVYNNSLAANGWDALGAYASDTGIYAASITTSITSIGNIAGEWVQLQSSIPLVLSSYSIASGSSAPQFPRTYYLIGSNDGSLWFPIQFSVINTNPFTAAYTSISSYITINTTGTQTIVGNQSGSVTTTAYSFSTLPYMFIRIVIPSIFPSNTFGKVSIGELYLNFSNSVSYSANYGATWLNTSRTVSNESVALSPSGQYALSTNSVAPLARLTLDNTNVDAQGVLAPTTGAGTVTYSTSIKAVGTHSAFFNQTAGSTTPSVYLNYIVPTVLNTPSVLTMSCWMYMSTMPASGISIPMSFSDTGNTVGGVSFFIGTNGTYMRFAYTATISGYAELNYSPSVLTNVWYHLVGVASAGVTQFYVNGTLIGSGTYSGLLCLTGGVNMSRLMVGAQYTSGQFAGAFHGYVDDVRLYTSALSADEINGLFRNPALTQTIAVSNSYLPITSYTEPVLPGITANVVDTAVSQTGQYMIAVTSSTTNNVYYSTDFGATFTALTIGGSAMVSCSISYDGTYMTVTNATTTYTLNENTRGFTLAIGNQAGRINQGLNAIAIGDKAGQTNQSNNSIVLNATGAALDAVAPGFYVAPVATASSSSLGSFSVLGYGTDNQIVQTGLTVLQNGFVGIGTTAPVQLLDITNAGSLTPAIRLQNTFSAGYVSMGSVLGVNSYIGLQATNTTTSALGTPTLIVANNGNVGIGTLTPSATLHVYNSSASFTTAPTVHIGDGQADAGGTYGMINLVRANNGADNKAHLAFIKNGLTIFGMGYYPGTNLSVFGLVPSFGTMAVNTGLWMDNTGSVGIGSTAPTVKLDVAGITRAGTFITATFTTASIANGAAIDVSQTSFGISITGMCLISVQSTTSGQFYATYIVNMWNPTIVAVSLLIANGIACSAVSNNLRITNNTGSTFAFKATVVCIASL